MANRRKRGKVQSSDNIAGLESSPEYIQAMAQTGRDKNGEIGNLGVERGSGYSNTDIANEIASWSKTLEQRDYEQKVWEERESLQGQVKQAQQAGINPALLAGGYSASGGSPVTENADMENSEHDAGPTGLDALNSIFSGLGDLSNIIGGAMQMRNQKKATDAQVAQSDSTIAVNDAEIRRKDAETELLRSQKINQDNLNSNFWRKVDDEHAESIVRQALGNANIGKIEFDKGMAERMAKIAEESNDIKKFEAESGRMLATQQCAKMIAEIQQMYYENQNLIKDAANKDQQWLIMQKQLKIMNEEITAASTKQTQTSLAKMYGVPDEWAFLCYATEQKMSEQNFNLWIQGFRESLVNKATAVDYVQESTFKLFGVQFGPASKQTRAGADGSPLLYKY